ncbi:MAG: hypothetical protein R3E79_37995 [Caldilineaceae bacterium]
MSWESPAAETMELVERIRRGEVRQDDKVTRRQGDKEDVPTAEPATVPADPIVNRKPEIVNLHNLLAQTTPLVVRKLTELTDRLTNPTRTWSRSSALAGWAKRAWRNKQAGVYWNKKSFKTGWFLSLAAVDANTFGPALNPLLNGLAGLFGLRLQGGASLQEQVLAYVQSRQMLLIFDNLEHLLVESEVLSRLPSGAPEITLLTTSRERLNLQEEWLFPLAGLALTLDAAPHPPKGRPSPAWGGSRSRADEAFYSSPTLGEVRWGAERSRPILSADRPTAATRL